MRDRLQEETYAHSAQQGEHEAARLSSGVLGFGVRFNACLTKLWHCNHSPATVRACSAAGTKNGRENHEIGQCPIHLEAPTERRQNSSWKVSPGSQTKERPKGQATTEGGPNNRHAHL